MFAVIKTDATETRNLVILDTIDCAREFLDKITGSFVGIPGMHANHDGDTVTVNGATIGDRPTLISTYTINPLD